MRSRRIQFLVVASVVGLLALGGARDVQAAPPTAVSIVAMPPPPAPTRGVSENGQWILGSGNGISTPLINWVTGASFNVPGGATAMSSDARFVLTITHQSLVPADTVPSSFDLYRWDRVANAYALVAGPPAGYFIEDAHISDNGAVVVFTATQSIPNGNKNVWTAVVGSAPTKLTTSGGGLVSYPINEVQDLTPDGRFLLYRTSCKYPSCPSNGAGDIRRYDRQTGATVRASLNNSGTESNGGDAQGTISPNGRYVTFQSAATNLGTGSTTEGARFVRDIATSTIKFLARSEGIQAKASTDDHGMTVFPALHLVNGQLWEQVLLREYSSGKTIALGTTNTGQPVPSSITLLAVSAYGNQAIITSNAYLVDGTSANSFMVGLRGVPTTQPSQNRLLDTRLALGIGSTTIIPGQQIVAVQVSGRAGVPVGTEAVLVNLAIVAPATNGFAKIYACDDDPGDVASINFAAGQNTANFTMARLSATGTVCVKASTAVHMVVDFQRVVTDFTAIRPVRPLDTRQPVDAPLPLLPNENRLLHVADANGVDLTTKAVALNVAVVGPKVNGYLQVFPCGETPTLAAANFSAGRTKASFVIARANASGDICFRSTAQAHLVVDLVGHLPADAGFNLIEARKLAGQVTFLGGRVIALDLGTGSGHGAPEVAMVGLVAANPSVGGYVTLFECGQPIPAVAALNFAAGVVTNNVALAPLDTNGRTCMFVSQNVRLYVDLFGAFAPF